jgi:hypothetical protein
MNLDVPMVFWIAGGGLLVIAVAVLVWVAMSGGQGGGNRPD